MGSEILPSSSGVRPATTSNKRRSSSARAELGSTAVSKQGVSDGLCIQVDEMFTFYGNTKHDVRVQSDSIRRVPLAQTSRSTVGSDSHSISSAVHFGIFRLLKHECPAPQKIRFGGFDGRFSRISVLIVDIALAQKVWTARRNQSVSTRA